MKNHIYLKRVLGCIVLILFTAATVLTGNVDAQTSFGDPFDGKKRQNSNWKWQNEPPTWDVGETREGFLYIDCERNRNIWANDASHFMYQETDAEMFDVETHFFAKWDTSSGVNGLLVKSDQDDNWVTLKFWGQGAVPKGQIQFQTKNNNIVGNAGWTPEFGDAELFMRLKKDGDEYTTWYKTEEGADWTQVGVTTFNLTPPLWLGIYAGVAAGDGNLEVEYEYFKDNMNPFPVEPGGKATTTWGAMKTKY